MIKKHATELYSNNCQLNQNLTQNMKRIKSQVNQLKKDMLNGNDKIKGHFSNLRDQVNVHSESLYLELDNIKSNLLNEINTFEAECIQNFEAGIDFRRALSKDISQINKFCIECEEFLHSGLKTKKILDGKDMICETNKTIQKLDLKSRQLESSFFNGRLMVYKDLNRSDSDKCKQLLNDLMGRVEVKTSTKSFELDNLNIKKFTRTSIKPSEVTSIGYVDKSRLFLFSQHTCSIVDIETLTELDHFVEKTPDMEITNVQVLNSSSKPVLIMNIYDTKTKCNFLKLFNEDLELKHQVKIFESSMIGKGLYQNEESIYCVSSTSSSFQLMIYNCKLEYANSLGQSRDPTMKYYFRSGAKQLIKKSRNYYVLDNEQFSVINEQSGKTIESIEIKAVKFHIDEANNELMFLSNNRSKIYCYNLAAEFLYDLELRDINRDGFITFFNEYGSEGNLVNFFNKASMCLYH